MSTRIGKIVTENSLRYDQVNYFTFDDSTTTANPIKHAELLKLVERFWSNESMGILDNPNESDDEKCLQLFNDSISYNKEERRYSVKLPFKIPPSELPSNRDLAFSRFVSNVKMLQRNPTYLQKYHAIFMEQLEKNIIEVAENDSPPYVHYLAHHGVISESKKHTKVRCVFDGSAKKKGSPSLNELLHKGPNLLPDLLGVLLRIRTMQILISGDIEKAFLMVELQEESRDFTRFFWLRDPSKGITRSNTIVYRFRRVPFGLICSPFLLAGTIHFHLSNTNTPLSRRILRNTYVDNVFYGVNTVQEGQQFYEDSKALFRDAGMNLRDYVSNNHQLNQFIKEKEDSKIDERSKILGITWNTTSDELELGFPNIIEDESMPWTKRRILQKVASIYDPFGWLTPVTLTGKIFIQKLWNENVTWDQILPHDLQEEWKKIIKSWTATHLTLPRPLTSKTSKDVKYEIHVFTDASQHGYAASSYLVEKIEGHPKRSSFLVSKSRLAPKKPLMTIPKLELSALVLGANLLYYLRLHLDIPVDRFFLWSDSRVALAWTQSEKDLPVFIRNRVRTIKDKTHGVSIRHVPGSMNPADLASRGGTMENLASNNLWWNGPDYLLKDDNAWPADENDLISKMQQLCCTSIRHEPELTPIIDSRRFSKWTRILGCVITILAFLTQLSSKAAHHFGDTSSKLRSKATTILFRMAQMENPPNKGLYKQLGLFKCKKSELLRVHTRIDNSALPTETKEPILLPKESNITALFILYVHEKNNHCGTEQTLIALRHCVWIPKGRSTIKRVINNRCFFCKRLKARPFKLPDFPLHPSHRVNKPNYPFENAALDVMGPIRYSSPEEEPGKCWMLLITCLNCRAIVVELIQSLSSTTFLHNLRRFIATYGCPKRIMCDNAPAFKTFAQAHGDEPIREVRDKDLKDYCAANKIQFKFIPAFSPWQGGVYERMVGIFKTAFKNAVGNRALPLENLRTLIKECEAICNSRPLTYVNDQADFIPLRPVDFIRPTAYLSTPHLLNEDEEWKPQYTTRDTLMQDWIFGLHLLNNFWSRWKDEYLTCLRERHQNSHPHPKSCLSDTPTHGEYVLIHDDNHPRGTWKMGQVCGSTDDYLRSAQIRLPSKRIITRPINLISRFEIDTKPTSTVQTPAVAEGKEEENTPPLHPMMTRSRRKRQLLQNAPTIFMILAALVAVMDAASTRCPTELTINKRIIYATPCVTNGIAVATYDDHEKHHLCWFPITCPNGEIQPMPSYPNDSRLCGAKCECPQWSQFCSHYNGEHTKRSQISNIDPTLLDYKPKEVCSFEKNPMCSHRKKIGTFNQIELYDGTLLLVPSLHVITKDYLDDNDFICIDSKGVRLPPTPPYKGTFLFCERHQCDSEVDKFCVYDSPITLLDLDNNVTSPNTVPIKAWGTTTKEFYPHNSGTNAEIISLKTNCSKGGVRIIVDRQISVVEACIQSYCIFAFNTTTTDLLFPTELVVFKYTITINAWKNGLHLYNSSITCPSHPICEILHCNICIEKAYNTQCWTTFDTTIIILLATVTISLYWIFAPIIHALKKLMRLQLVLFKYVVNRLCKRRSEKRDREADTIPSNHRIYNRRKPTPSYRTHSYRISPSAVALTILAYTTHDVICCSDVISITSSTESCITKDLTSTCTFNTGTTIALQPLGQEVCLSLRNQRNEPIGLISLRMLSIRHVCQRKVEFFTRDHEISTESVHRCYRMGSCKRDKCDNTKSSDIIEEFSWKATNMPGFTFCNPSCGCLLTCGCLSCQPSCLFYRYYAAPTSEIIYTVFTCPSWELTVTAEITLQLQQERKTFTMLLRPGRATRTGDITLSLLSTISPQLPILASAFITDGTRTAMTMKVQANELTPATPAQLQCASKLDATQFLCRFSSRACTCSTGSYKATCTCPQGHISPYLTRNTLPLITKNVIIEQHDDTIAAHTRVGSAIFLQLTMENVKVVSVQNKGQCSITSSSIEGCYSCLLGAKVSIICYSTEEQTTADITCEQEQQVAICTKTGKLNEMIFHFHSPEIATKCTISCPGGLSSFQIEGALDYVNDAQIQEEISTNNEERIDHTGNALNTVTEWIYSLPDTVIGFLLNLNLFTSIKIFLTCITFIILLHCIAFVTSFLPKAKKQI
ncbi:integrase core domain protein [Teladorsagia circumcincta]|uniref:Integrase core domain protein n=1 Tax=Teladorsagia circumcincta TaxID=45464 RepID=A0A2G9UNI1_TELCI|nr:integrase core domain protein [Teladorsagia circumcincta]